MERMTRPGSRKRALANIRALQQGASRTGEAAFVAVQCAVSAVAYARSERQLQLKFGGMWGAAQIPPVETFRRALSHI